MTYNVADWYWKADDNRIFSSKRQMLVAENDAGYIAFSEQSRPTPWPRTVAGEQTDESLQEVLTPYNLYATLIHYSAHVRDVTLAAGITVNGQPFATDPITTMSLNSAFIYVQGKATETFSWKLPDGSFITLDKAQITELQSCVAAYGQSCFECEDTTATAIDAGTITTHAQVDAAYAAVSNTFTSVAEMDAAMRTIRKRRRR